MVYFNKPRRRRRKYSYVAVLSIKENKILINIVFINWIKCVKISTIFNIEINQIDHIFCSIIKIK